jgi:hypothetical protein
MSVHHYRLLKGLWPTREGMYNILIEFGIPVELVWLIKMFKWNLQKNLLK